MQENHEAQIVPEADFEEAVLEEDDNEETYTDDKTNDDFSAPEGDAGQ